jgi:rRNA maturation RNase YbeY
MQFDIENLSSTPLDPEWLQTLDDLLPLYAAQENLPDALVIGLTFVDGDEIRRVNKEYRAIDSVTDVLSFPMYEPDEAIDILEGELTPFGDIVVCLPRAKEQAQEYGHSLRREVLYLIVHGLMHLAGYDHMEADEKAEMRAAEEDLLAKVDASRD